MPRVTPPRRLGLGEPTLLPRPRRLAAALGLAWLVGARAVWADGAFPDADRILLPPDEPDTLILGTNFGLISTTDNGATWTWSCETALVNGGRGYQLAAAEGGRPLRRIVAVSSWGLVHSDDVGCTWAASEGAGQEDAFSDVFVSSTAPASAWALGIDPTEATGLPEVVFTSADGAATLSGPVFRVPGGDQLLGVEPAASDPATVYVTFASGPDAPWLAVTVDGGAHWDTTALAAAVGPGYLRILAVDAASPTTVYLRQSTASGDRLLVTRDGGTSWRVALSVAGSLSAFLQRGDGALLVGTLEPDGEAIGYRSSDGGRTFLPWPGVPHLRALAERDGTVFAAADDVQDGFALGVSVDGGDTFRALLRYADVGTVAPCVRSDCRVTCERLAAIELWASKVCAAPEPAPSDASSPTPADGPDGGSAQPGDAAARAGSGATPSATSSSSTNGCVIGEQGSLESGRLAKLLLGFAALRGRGRWSRKRASRRSSRPGREVDRTANSG